MVKALMHDPFFLGIKSKPATAADADTARDLLDTLMAHRETCVGMAANMIGVSRRIIAFNDSGSYIVMFNPEITAKSLPCRCSADRARPRAGKRSPSNIRTPPCASEPKPTAALRHRSSSTRSTTATGF